MFGIKYTQLITALTVLVPMLVPSPSFARVSSLIGGVSVGLDSENRNGTGEDYRYRRILFSPMMQFKSLGEKDSFELRAAPGIKYDLLDSGTDWDSTFDISANRFITKSLQVGLSNNFIRSDYNGTNYAISNSSAVTPTESTTAVTTSTGPIQPELSNDRGRQRYWENTSGLFTNYFYRQDSVFRLDFNYVALRNDNNTNNSVSSNEDYDRYVTGLRNEHRFNVEWKSTVDLQFVRGIFPSSDPVNLSKDLNEYHMGLTIANESIAHNPLSLSYNYIGTKYDETLLNDSDIHQGRLTWRRDFSPHIYTNLGIGPSYAKTEEQNGTWGGNGVAEINYAVEHGYYNFKVEKNYDVDNFSGTNDRALIDVWETRFSASRQLLKEVTLIGNLAYISEDRKETLATSGNGNLPQIDKVQRDIYIAGAGLKYNFWQFYSAGIDYTYTKQDSDRVDDSYDDHRILLTLSWEKELFHW